MCLSYFKEKLAASYPLTVIKNINQRVAIIGAGATGLAAAEVLQQKGYEHVKLFERNSHAGGKCRSIVIEGKIYELGAGVITKNNTVPFSLAEKYQVPIKKAVYGENIFVDENGQFQSKWTCREKLDIYWQLFVRYRAILKKYQAIERPGFLNIDPDLTVPFSQFASKNKITDLADVFNLYLTGFGYCYSNHIPAAYVLKYLDWPTIRCFIKNQAYVFPDGIQNLWVRVAQDHTVQYGADIKHIARNTDVITIERESALEEFDSLILTTPLDEVENFIDLTDTERTFFNKIETLDYKTILCTVKNLPKKSGFIPDNFCAERSGHPVFWYYRHADSNVYSFYMLAAMMLNQEVVIENLNKFVVKMGGEIEFVHQAVDWKYFPHVGTRDLREGFYEQLANMQGQKNTYYLGELLNFSCIGATTDYAQKFIAKHF